MHIIHPLFLLKSHPPQSMTIVAFILIFVLTVSLPSFAQEADVDQQFLECSNRYSCGQNITNVGYPFWGGNRPRACGLDGFELSCRNSEYPTIEIDGHTFRVLRIDTKRDPMMMRIARDDMWKTICPSEHYYTNTTFNEELFRYASAENEYLNVYYSCPSEYWKVTEVNQTRRYHFNCGSTDREETVSFIAEKSFSFIQLELEPCKNNITVPVLREAVRVFKISETMRLEEMLNWGFDVEYLGNTSKFCMMCEGKDGVRFSCPGTTDPSCLCRNGTNGYVCPNGGGGGFNRRLKIITGFAAVGVTIIVMCVVFYFYQRRKKKSYAGSSWMSSSIFSNSSSIKDLEKAGTYLGVHIFSYKELEEATNKFDSKKELGDGGFGAVYKGKLKDGRVVAVKRLYENNFKRVQQFMNEVGILAHLRHQNLVSLYGCTSHRCHELLLVYEYVSNGTVADHLHGERQKPGSLTWTTRMSIAIETASALAYLHASDVIHRDVKTSNILLCSNFHVKVADFGLSRLFPLDVTHVSTAPQGTPGYVDPEYHDCYQLTAKSDVFSFGVVLIELISSMPAVDITRHRHEINLFNMAINKIQIHALHELVDPSLGYESDYKISKMINAVAELAFNCLQNEREMRPSMKEVLEELKGISGKDPDTEKKDKVDTSADDAVLLKNNSQTLSPVSVAEQWLSNSTTCSSSG